MTAQALSAPATAAADLPGHGHYARNLIGGEWRFPAAPYEFEIRNPLDSTVTTTVPLSSRFDVARAVAAAGAAAGPWSADPEERVHLLGRLVDELDRLAGPLAAVQSRESGLSPADSRFAVDAVVRAARALVTARAAAPAARSTHGVSGHLLSWGLPVAEVICATLPALLAGHSIVVKPSLRAPMSTVVFGHLATRLGFPAGVVNIVQGTGIDVGAALYGTGGLAALSVRAGERTLAQASRAAAVSGTPLRPLRAGGNVVLAGPAADPAVVAAAVRDAIRVHSTGGPLALPLLAVHSGVSDPVVDAVRAAVAGCAPAPLPTQPLRQQALARIARLRRQGARLLCGRTVPDDVRHRMGWLLPATVLAVGALRPGAGPGGTGDPLGDPIGPVLTVATWRSPGELRAGLAHPRYADGVACVFGLSEEETAAVRLPHRAVLAGRSPRQALAAVVLPAAWTGHPRASAAGAGFWRR